MSHLSHRDRAAFALKAIDLEVDLDALEAVEKQIVAAVAQDRLATRTALARLEEAVEALAHDRYDRKCGCEVEFHDLAADLRRLREGLA